MCSRALRDAESRSSHGGYFLTWGNMRHYGLITPLCKKLGSSVPGLIQNPHMLSPEGEISNE